MKKTILVIDDDKSNLIIAQRLLTEEYKVAAINSGRLAFEYLSRHTPSAILLDIQMPEMDGFEVMERLRSDEIWCKIPVIFLTADKSSETEEKCFDMGAVDYIGKPFIPQIMRKRVARMIELEEYRKSLERMVAIQLSQITKMQHDVIITMANVIESRDGTTGEHVKRTSAYTMLLAEKMIEKGLYSDELDIALLENMRSAAPLHDIGKITIPDAVLSKPGKLTSEEYETIKSHAKAGADMISNNMNSIVSQDFLKVACDMARYHHEKWNGKGYPEGLAGKEIPLSARILAITDVFDALVSKRQYKEGMSVDEAFKIMAPDRGEGFEAEILDVFFELHDELEGMIKEMEQHIAETSDAIS